MDFLLVFGIMKEGLTVYTGSTSHSKRSEWLLLHFTSKRKPALCYWDSVGMKTYTPCNSPSSTPAFKFTDCVLKHGYFTQRTLTIVSKRTGLPLFQPFRSESYPGNPPVNLLGLRVDPTTIPSWSRSGFRHTRPVRTWSLWYICFHFSNMNVY